MTGKTSLPSTLLALAVGAVVLTGCAGKSVSGNLGTSAPASALPTAASGSPSVGSSPSPTVDQTINITYANGKVTGASAVVTVKHNSMVALVVTSDVADEVHFHGYNKMADVAKGGTVTIVFRATLQGRFEVELEKLKHRLVILQIQ
ncbi:MAG: hypothetical protein JWO88_1898 [Frankiales bacterium]|jgi:hypothetical protein|nr:hypothetical protein [Frankiales bacterium]